MRAFLKQNAKWLGAGAALTFLSGFGQTYFIAVFAGSLRGEFDLSHGAWGGIYTLGTLSSAVVMVWAGGLADQYRVRVLGPLVLGLLAVACGWMAANASIWALPVIIFLLRFAGQGMCSHLAAVSMARWFVATRGRALAIASLGFSLGEGTLPVLCVALMGWIDWHWIWVGAACVALLGIPGLLALLRTERTPASVAQDQATPGMRNRHWTRGEALRDPLFWMMVPAVAGLSAFGTVFFFQQVEFAAAKGWSHLQLTALFPIYPLVSMAAMMGWGWALDKIGTARLLPVFLIPVSVGFVLFAVTQSVGGTILGMIAFGITSGANATVPTAFWTEFYGSRHIGAIKALATAVMVFGSAVGPGVSGLMLDAGIGIEAQMFGFAVYFVLITVLLTFAVRRAARDLPTARV